MRNRPVISSLTTRNVSAAPSRGVAKARSAKPTTAATAAKEHPDAFMNAAASVQKKQTAVLAKPGEIPRLPAIPKPSLPDDMPQWGLELEVNDLSLLKTAQAVALALGGTLKLLRSGEYRVEDAQGRKWEVKPDNASSEVATPIMHTVEDVAMVQDVADALKAAGATVNDDTGLHIHLDASFYKPVQIVQVLALIARHEPALYSALGVYTSRRKETCSDFPAGLVKTFVDAAPEDFEAFTDAYDDAAQPRKKYRGVNIENLWDEKGTIEFRYFNATLDRARIGHYLALVSKILETPKGFEFPDLSDFSHAGSIRDFVAKVGLSAQDGTGKFLIDQAKISEAGAAATRGVRAHQTSENFSSRAQQNYLEKYFPTLVLAFARGHHALHDEITACMQGLVAGSDAVDVVARSVAIDAVVKTVIPTLAAWVAEGEGYKPALQELSASSSARVSDAAHAALATLARTRS